MKITALYKIIFSCIIGVALLVRVLQLQNIPSGLHHDEVWFAYNAFLLAEQGTNLYNEKFPLTVDMWGEHVSAAHSYWAVPFISLFGLHTAAFRLTTVTFSLLTLLAAAFFLYRVTRKSLVVLIFSLLFALSPWNISMARASSTVIIDTFFLLVFIIILYEAVASAARSSGKQRFQFSQLTLFAGAYITSLVCYLTYFTSRLLIIPIGIGVLAFAYLQNNRIGKGVIIGSVSVLVAYFIFPFLTFLQTPYAQGRFKETTVIQSQSVQAAIFEDITTSGLAQLPPLVTRAIYNKVSVNFDQFFLQYVSFFSPTIMLGQLDTPARYTIVDVAPITYLEYLGFVLAIGLLISPFAYVKDPGNYKILLFLVFCLLCSAIPTALTIDDFPNFQRGVIMTPFWQMVAAIAFSMLIAQFAWFNRLKASQQLLFALGGVALFSSVNFLPFVVKYFYINPHYKPYFRSYPDYALGEWINRQSAEERMVVGDNDYTFIYPYFLAGQNFLQLPIRKTEGTKYFLKTKEFQIGNRIFVQTSDLCQDNLLQEKILQFDPQYIVLKYFENSGYSACYIPSNYQAIDTIEYINKQKAYVIFGKKSPQTEEIRKILEASVSARVRKE
jgi:hypothetical protein